MAWTYEEVMAKLGDEAQAVPGAIVVFRGRHIVVAEVTVGRGFVVTPEGESILEDTVEIVSEVKKGKSKAKTVVQEDVVADTSTEGLTLD